MLYVVIGVISAIILIVSTYEIVRYIYYEMHDDKNK
jgi:hypothetical protein